METGDCVRIIEGPEAGKEGTYQGFTRLGAMRDPRLDRMILEKDSGDFFIVRIDGSAVSVKAEFVEPC